jgi:ABC-type methionine transport system ATPase subunit
MSSLSTIGHRLSIQPPNDELLAKFLDEVNSLKEDGLNATVIVSKEKSHLAVESKFPSLELEVTGEIAKADRAIFHLRKNWEFFRSSEFIQVRIQIPENQHQEPVISHLVSDFGVNVNIKTAFLGANGVGGGWFALEIEGERNGLEQVITHLTDRHLLIA